MNRWGRRVGVRAEANRWGWWGDAAEYQCFKAVGRIMEDGREGLLLTRYKGDGYGDEGNSWPADAYWMCQRSTSTRISTRAKDPRVFEKPRFRRSSNSSEYPRPSSSAKSQSSPKKIPSTVVRMRLFGSGGRLHTFFAPPVEAQM